MTLRCNPKLRAHPAATKSWKSCRQILVSGSTSVRLVSPYSSQRKETAVCTARMVRLSVLLYSREIVVAGDNPSQINGRCWHMARFDECEQSGQDKLRRTVLGVGSVHGWCVFEDRIKARIFLIVGT